MKLMAINDFSFTARKLLWVGALVCLQFGFGFACGATPQPLYQNFGDSVYYSPPTVLNPLNSPPQIDATAFDNEGTFEIDDSIGGNKIIPYTTSDTLYYTNGDAGVMIAISPISDAVIYGGLVDAFSIGAGFNFECVNPTNAAKTKMASVFYNSGVVRCNSILDSSSIFGLDGLGTLSLNAANIYNPGTIQLGVDSLLSITGTNVDLTRSVLDIESLQYDEAALGYTILNNFGDINLNSTGAFGVDTNGDWNPGVDLTATTASSSGPYNLDLTNSVPYYREDVGDGGTNFIIRAVFVQNNSPNAPASVFIQPVNSPLAGNGTAYVEWAGTYTDPATGNSITNYLYLVDDYALGASTNVQITPGPGNVGYPDNFSFYASSVQYLSGPLTASPPNNLFQNGSITNPYAYMSGTIIPSTTATNATQDNPNGTITNVAGRIVISAANELNLNNAVISGENYLSIQASNQFDGSAGSYISSPYSDISLGVTNGAIVPMTVSNLLISDIPLWSGGIQAWSTRWTNSVNGNNYDFRVLLVNSQLQPTTQPWVKSLYLRTGTNGLVITDDLNVYSSFFTDASSLTVSTNGFGFGATSSEGVLNTVYLGNLGQTNWPNLLCVTNNGTLAAQNLIYFTNQTVTGGAPGSAKLLGSVINNGLIIDQGTFIYATNFLNSGAISNGIGNLTVVSQTTTLTNGLITAGSKVSIAANDFSAGNTALKCLSLTLNPARSITDFSVTNNIWVVGSTNGSGGAGLVLLNNPTNGDLRGTTITNICPPSNKSVANTWCGRDYGAVNSGFTNNAALGHLILDVAGPNSLITFTGTGVSNALYVDCLELQGTVTNGLFNNYNFTNWLALNTNITIYFAQALIGGVSVAEAVDQASLYSGENGGVVSNYVVIKPGRLRWVPTYAGIFSSTNFVSNGVTNSYNAALAESKDIDSNNNGSANANDPAPFTLPVVTPGQLNFAFTSVTQPIREALLSWNIVSGISSNVVYYSPSLTATNWLTYTNFLSTNYGAAFPVSVADTNIIKGTRFYKLLVQQMLQY